MPDKKEKQPLLTIRGLKTFFPVKSGFLGRAESYVQAVNDIDLTIYRGETLGLVGESGCGKTTLGKTILQLYKPTGSSVLPESLFYHLSILVRSVKKVWGQNQSRTQKGDRGFIRSS